MENTEKVIETVAEQVIEEAPKAIINVSKPMVIGIGVAATGGVAAAGYLAYKGIMKLIGWVQVKRSEAAESEED